MKVKVTVKVINQKCFKYYHVWYQIEGVNMENEEMSHMMSNNYINVIYHNC